MRRRSSGKNKEEKRDSIKSVSWDLSPESRYGLPNWDTI